MKKLLIATLLTLTLVTCKKPVDEPAGEETLKGRYMGTFYRTSGDTVSISLLFSGNSFEGQSDRLKYPAICRGVFSVDKPGNRISFDDACMWTADFDWSLILDGDYELYFNEDKSVSIVRHSFVSADFYKLWKVIR